MFYQLQIKLVKERRKMKINKKTHIVDYQLSNNKSIKRYLDKSVQCCMYV